MEKKYKLWLHLEEVTVDEKGSEIDYRSLDDEVLPLPAAYCPSILDAIEVMQEISNIFYEE